MNLFQVSIFGFRNLLMTFVQTMPAMLRPNPGPLDPYFYFTGIRYCALRFSMTASIFLPISRRWAAISDAFW
jgi:hypothetical protein